MMASTSEQIRDLEGGGADRRAAKCVELSHRVRDIAEETRDANTTRKNGTRGSHNRVHHQRPLSSHGDLARSPRTPVSPEMLNREGFTGRKTVYVLVV